MSFELPGCFAMTETGHGSDVQQLRTTRTYDPQTQTFDLHTPHQAARKDYIGNAAKDAKAAVVFAQLITGGRPAAGRGVHAWSRAAPRRRRHAVPGVTIEDDGAKAGLNGVDNGRLTFDHVRLPRDSAARPLRRRARGRHVLQPDRERDPPLLHHARHPGARPGERRRLGVVGDQAGPRHRRPVRATCAASSPRPAPIARSSLNDYLVHLRKLLPALAHTYALHFAQDELVSTMHDVQTAVHEHGQQIDETAQRELESRAAGLKVAQTWHATRTIQLCREACGGAGYLQENRLPHLKADTDVFTTFEGDNTVLLQLVAKGLLTGYRDAFGSLDGSGKVGFIADMVRETVLERTAARGLIARLIDAVPGRDDDVPLLDRGWQLKLFEFREKHILEGAIRRLRRNAATDGMAPFDMFNDVQDHVLAAARRTSTGSCWRRSSPASTGLPTRTPRRCSRPCSTSTRSP